MTYFNTYLVCRLVQWNHITHQFKIRLSTLSLATNGTWSVVQRKLMFGTFLVPGYVVHRLLISMPLMDWRRIRSLTHANSHKILQVVTLPTAPYGAYEFLKEQWVRTKANQIYKRRCVAIAGCMACDPIILQLWRMEEAYRFAETPTLAVYLVDHHGGHQHDKDMAQTHTRSMMISEDWVLGQPRRR